MNQNSSEQKIRIILKFDTGADGFMRMIYVLAVSAVCVLISGVIFLAFYYPGWTR